MAVEATLAVPVEVTLAVEATLNLPAAFAFAPALRIRVRSPRLKRESPAWLNAVLGRILEAANSRSDSRLSLWPGFSSWECRAAQFRHAPPVARSAPHCERLLWARALGTASHGGRLTVLPHSTVSDCTS